MTFTKEELSTLCARVKSPQPDNEQLVVTLKSLNLSLRTECRDVSQNYSWLLDNLLDAFKPDVSKLLSKEVVREIDAVVENGPAAATLLVLVNKIQNTDDAIQLNHSVHLLETFLDKNHLGDLLWNECVSNEDSRRALHNDLVVVISSLPERLANKLRHENRDAFLPVNYVAKLTRTVIETCRRIANDLRSGGNRSVEFLGSLVAKLCQCGYGRQFWKEVFARIGSQFEKDFVLARVWEKVLSHVPGHSCESVLVPMLNECPCYGVIGRLLGDSIRSDSRVKFLLTNKLILHRYYSDTKILLNILGYASKLKDTLEYTMKNILQVWSSAGYVRRTSYEQQKYICSAILLGFAFMPEDMGGFGNYLNEKCLQGVPHYLDSGIERVRVLGMILAEVLTEKANPTGESLQFEYAETEDTRELKALLDPPEAFCDLKDNSEQTTVIETDAEDAPDKEGSTTADNIASVNIDDLDSDDDLEPYDLSNDKPKMPVKEPKYIRQCMEGFLAREDPDTFEISLQNAAKIVRKNPSQAKELAEEFALISLRTEDQYDTENFQALLRDLLVALICANPKVVAEKLCEEFYARNYNIKQRLDILDALAQGAQHLARLDTTENQLLQTQSVHSEMKSSNFDGEGDWRAIVDQRIKAKTRRFASAKREITETENKFGPVAGYFFFPLLNPMSVDPAVDLRGRDSILLVRLLYTLSMVLHAAVNTPLVSRMGSTLFDSVWLFRTHSDASVRRGTLFAVNIVFLSVPPFALLGEMEKQVTESKFWLEHVLREDQDSVCRELAKQGLLLLVNALKSSGTVAVNE